MSQLIETIKIYNGRVYNIKYHNNRCNQSRKALFDQNTLINLRKFIKIPSAFKKGLVKCRITYAHEIIDIHFELYRKKPIKSLQCVYTNDFEYDYKYKNRDLLDKLFKQKKQSDDILIINNEFLTDCYYTNIAVWDGENWFTPKQNLLNGTMRQQLLDKGIIKTRSLKLSDLKNFEHIALFNALIPFKSIILDTTSINR